MHGSLVAGGGGGGGGGGGEGGGRGAGGCNQHDQDMPARSTPQR